MTFDSVYEMTTPLKEVRRQHFWEYFSGKDIDNQRWNWTEASGTRSASGMELGGYYVTTSGSNSGYYGQLKFNGKYMFDAESSGFVAVTRAHSVASTGYYIGLHEDSYFAVENGANETYFRASTRNNLVGTTAVATTVALDTNWHSFKMTTNGTSAPMIIDGVLASTSTGTLPSDGAGHLEPWWQVYTTGGTSKTCSIRYLECFNI